MKAFAEILQDLPSIKHLAAMELMDGDQLIARIENKPGQAGSLAVYYAVSQDSGVISRDEANRALELYAEHTEDAQLNPGKHPNIDRLFEIITAELSYSIQLEQA